MQFGLRLKQPGLDPADYPEVAHVAEANGFESVWTPEHLLLRDPLPATYPYNATGRAGLTPATEEFDPWVALAAVASATTRVRLGTSVYILPLRHPVVTARAVMTLDRVSRGRAILGIGVGWLEPEFDDLDQSFADRGRRAVRPVGWATGGAVSVPYDRVGNHRPVRGIPSTGLTRVHFP